MIWKGILLVLASKWLQVHSVRQDIIGGTLAEESAPKVPRHYERNHQLQKVPTSIVLLRDSNSFNTEKSFKNPAACIQSERIVRLQDPILPLAYRRRHISAMAFQLPNCVKFLVFSAVNYHYSTSGGSISFPFGFFSDDADIPGLSHLVEHMVFQGSKNFPNGKTLDERAPTRNGVTTNKQTEYYFSQKHEDFPEALSVFYDAIVFPIMRPEAVLKEILAMHSEWMMHTVKDLYRSKKLLLTMSNKHYPGHKANWGNAKTLLKGSLGSAEVLATRAKKFHKENYAGDGMSVVVATSRSTQRMLETMTRSSIMKLPSARPLQKWEKAQNLAFPPEDLPFIIHDGTSNPGYSLSLQFPVFTNSTVASTFLNMLNPYVYLPFATHASYGVESELSATGWISGYKFSVRRMAEVTTIQFFVQIREQFADKRDEIITKIFSHIKSVQENKIPLHRIDERQRAGEVNFFFTQDPGTAQQGSYLPLARALQTPIQAGIHSLHWFGTADIDESEESEEHSGLMSRRSRAFRNHLGRGVNMWVNGTKEHVEAATEKILHRSVNKKSVGEDVVILIDEILKLMTPHNMIIYSKNPKVAEEAKKNNWDGWKHEDFMDVMYLKESVSPSLVEKIQEVQPAPKYSEEKNDLIPKTITPKQNIVRKYEYSNSIQTGWNFRVGHISPSSNPKAILHVRIETTDFPGRTPTNHVLLSATSSLMKTVCNEHPDLAKYHEAGFTCVHVWAEPGNLTFQIRGLAAHMKAFFQDLFKAFGSYRPTDANCQIALAAIHQQFDTSNKTPLDQAIGNGLSIVDDLKMTQHELRSVETSPTRMRTFYSDIIGVLLSRRGSGASWWRKLVSYVYPLTFTGVASGTFQGRWTDNEAKELTEAVMNTLKLNPGNYRRISERRTRCRTIPRGKTIIRAESYNKKDVSYGLTYMFQFPQESAYQATVSTTIMKDLLMPLLSVEFTNEIRTKRQLGYATRTQYETIRGTPHVLLSVQSEVANPIQLAEVFEEFLENFEARQLSTLDMNYVAAAIKRRSGGEEIEPPRLEDIEETWRLHWSRGGVQRRVLVSEVWPVGSQKAEHIMHRPKETIPVTGVFATPNDLKTSHRFQFA
eukprot:GHVP01039606.1.p1 GENE.GHVP01039606.1~~GHVP01039606.1.p1  ORF type:complete len:1103 (-),score=182.22 GHVP01039606.1:32-3340(-)